MWPTFLISGSLNNFWTYWAIRFKFGTDMEDWPRVRMEYNTTSKMAWPGSRDQISKFWDPLITWMDRAIHFKFGTDVEDGPRLHRQRAVFASLWALFHLCFITPPPLIGGGIKRCFCLTYVCLTSVAYIGPKSITERPRKTKIGTEVAHVTRDSDTTFRVKRSTVKVTRPLWLAVQVTT